MLGSADPTKNEEYQGLMKNVLANQTEAEKYLSKIRAMQGLSLSDAQCLRLNST